MKKIMKISKDRFIVHHWNNSLSLLNFVPMVTIKGHEKS